MKIEVFSLLQYLSLHPLDYSHRWWFALFLTVYGCLICINPKDDTQLMGGVMSYMSRMSSGFPLTFMNICVHWNFCSVKLLLHSNFNWYFYCRFGRACIIILIFLGEQLLCLKCLMMVLLSTRMVPLQQKLRFVYLLKYLP